MNDAEMRTMLIEYMGRGFLDNIIAMMRQEPGLCRFIPDLMGDEAIRVRMGGTALVEVLVYERNDGLSAAVPGLVSLLRHESPVVRGDAANVLGLIGDPSAVDALRRSLQDEHPGVRQAAQEAIDAILVKK